MGSPQLVDGQMWPDVAMSLVIHAGQRLWPALSCPAGTDEEPGALWVQWMSFLVLS